MNSQPIRQRSAPQEAKPFPCKAVLSCCVCWSSLIVMGTHTGGSSHRVSPPPRAGRMIKEASEITEYAWTGLAQSICMSVLIS